MSTVNLNSLSEAAWLKARQRPGYYCSRYCRGDDWFMCPDINKGGCWQNESENFDLDDSAKFEERTAAHLGMSIVEYCTRGDAAYCEPMKRGLCCIWCEMKKARLLAEEELNGYRN